MEYFGETLYNTLSGLSSILKQETTERELAIHFDITKSTLEKRLHTLRESGLLKTRKVYDMRGKCCGLSIEEVLESKYKLKVGRKNTETKIRKRTRSYGKVEF